MHKITKKLKHVKDKLKKSERRETTETKGKENNLKLIKRLT